MGLCTLCRARIDHRFARRRNFYFTSRCEFAAFRALSLSYVNGPWCNFFAPPTGSTPSFHLFILYSESGRRRFKEPRRECTTPECMIIKTIWGIFFFFTPFWLVRCKWIVGKWASKVYVRGVKYTYTFMSDCSARVAFFSRVNTIAPQSINNIFEFHTTCTFVCRILEFTACLLCAIIQM